jgi:hypothetical protein
MAFEQIFFIYNLAARESKQGVNVATGWEPPDVDVAQADALGVCHWPVFSVRLIWYEKILQ